MGRNKKSLIIVASIIAMIILLLITLLILFFTTDLFKNDQELFFKYLAKNGDIIQGYFKDPNENNKDIIKQGKHMVKTGINFDLVSSDPTIADQTLPPRNFSIQYVGQSDPQNQMNSSEATIKYLTKDLFKVKYAHTQDLYALTSDEVFAEGKYLGLDNNQLKEFAKKIGYTDVSKIPNRIENIDFSDIMNIKEEDKKYLQETYLRIIDSEISKNHYSSKKNVMIKIDAKEIKANCYTLTLNSNEYKNVLIALLNNLQQDDKTLNMILEKIMLIDSQTEMTLETLKTNIGAKINEISSKPIEDIIIRVYEKDGELVRTELEKQNQDKYTFDFEKNHNSIRSIVNYEYNYSERNNVTNNQEPISNTIDEGYTQIGGFDNTKENTVTNVQPNETSNQQLTLKSIEIAKQIEGNQTNTIVIATFEMHDKTVKISVQSKTTPDEQNQGTINNNIIININDSDVTYFTVKVNTILSATDTVIVEQVNEQNSFTANNFTPEYLKELIKSIQDQLKKIYNEKMQIASTVQQEENATNGLNQVDPDAPETNTITSNTLNTEI